MSFRKKKKQPEPVNHNIPNHTLEKYEHEKITRDVEETASFINSYLGENDDFIVRRILIFETYHAIVFYFANLTDQKKINNDILKPLMTFTNEAERQGVREITTVLSEEILYHSELQLESGKGKLVQRILEGDTVVVIDGTEEALVIGTRQVDKRSIEQPETETVIIGPKEAFIERLDVNVGLLRYRLQTPDFRVKELNAGRLTKTKAVVCYLKGTANESIVNDVEERLSQIDTDAILDVGYLEQFIEDNHFSPFPQTYITERPDSVIGNLIEGRVAVLCDGSPFAMVVPVVFAQFLQTTEDYSTRFLMGSFVRIVRVLALIFSLAFPSLYVSFISFNPELLPTEFAVAVAGGRAGVPYPAVVEVLLIETAMEVLREATVRLPKQFGGALSIVGVLVIGEAAVAAGLSSPITVVVIALTTIGSFATPVYSASFALRMLRFPLMILAGVFGLYGVIVGLILIFNHMLSLESFGVPYMSPISPGNAGGMKDILIRSPFWWMPRRPKFLRTMNEKRIQSDEGKLFNGSNDSRKASRQ